MKSKRKRKHKYQRKPVRYLSDWKKVRALARYTKKIHKLIKAFREQVITLGVANPF